jgi:hypothetical protein
MANVALIIAVEFFRAGLGVSSIVCLGLACKTDSKHTG